MESTPASFSALRLCPFRGRAISAGYGPARDIEPIPRIDPCALLFLAPPCTSFAMSPYLTWDGMLVADDADEVQLGA